MKYSPLLMLGVATAGVALLCYTPVAAAQQSQTGPNVGQQGEFNGEHVDTGAAALDTGPEATMEAAESLTKTATTLAVLQGKAPTAATSAGILSGKPGQNLDLEQSFDLQEIAGPDLAESLQLIPQ